MNNYWKFATPKYLTAGMSLVSNLTDYINDFGIKKPFIVIDPKLKKESKAIKALIKQLESLDIFIFEDFSTNPTTDQVSKSVSFYLKFKPDSVIAIGGGSAIDLAKATTLVALNGGNIEEYLAGRKGNREFPPFIAIPSTCGTGSEASPYAVILDPKTKKKRGIEDSNFLPKLVVLDPRLLDSLDTTILAATAIDALAHILESFISKKANEITRSSARGLMIGLKKYIEDASVKRDLNAGAAMLNASFSSRLLYPRTGLTIAHALSHPLGAYTNIHHGMAVSFFLPVSFKVNQEYCKDSLKEAVNLLGFTNLEQFDQWFKDFCDKAGITSYLCDYLKDEDLPIEILAKDALESSNIPSNPKPVNKEDLIGVINDSLAYWRIYGN